MTLKSLRQRNVHEVTLEDGGGKKLKKVAGGKSLEDSADFSRPDMWHQQCEDEAGRGPSTRRGLAAHATCPCVCQAAHATCPCVGRSCHMSMRVSRERLNLCVCVRVHILCAYARCFQLAHVFFQKSIKIDCSELLSSRVSVLLRAFTLLQ